MPPAPKAPGIVVMPWYISSSNVPDGLPMEKKDVDGPTAEELSPFVK
jgi:hypothetical protein